MLSGSDDDACEFDCVSRAAGAGTTAGSTIIAGMVVLIVSDVAAGGLAPARPSQGKRPHLVYQCSEITTA